ncbi:HupE/UreJ family protein [Ensifer sp. MJa1]|uniref:HupE/UreJ family protein n=1 Tax=Ensifer sp. MJa1 TaxID=2919888 RepID=UPI003008B718
MIRRLSIFLLVFAAGPAGSAFAHSPIKGIGSFYNGMLHPLLVPAHLLALVAVGLLIGQHAPGAGRLSLPAFMGAVAVALAVTALADPVLPQWPILALALIAGLSIAASWSGGLLLPIVLSLLAAILVGLDSAPDGTGPQRAWVALSGTAVGTTLIIIYCGGLSAWFHRPWQRIAVRAVGSWIAASALLVLTLDLMSGRSPA